ncbi:MOSC domain-containing protein [Yoonia sp. 208BN28-4]|uniref:MOSC domain-containing protein n=1 Tax=Yoonia sp. 208BN28-4 TaxID=3126505 RepID=UPI0030AB800E
MPALKPTDLYGEITWIGTVPEDAGLQSVARDVLTLTYAGPEGEAHSGLTRPSCVRVKSQWPPGTEIRNVRQLSVMSQEEIDEIAVDCGLENLDPALLGATLVIRGIPDFTHVPPSSRLQNADLSTLVIDMENRPCVLPGREIEAEYPGAGAKFKPAAKDKRGVTAWVEHEGEMRVGDKLRLHVPDQRAWLSQPDLFDT